MSSQQQRTQLQEALEDAVRQEDYQRAAAIKQQLQELDESDELTKLQKMIAQAVAEERYKDAAQYKLQLEQLEQQLGQPADLSKLATCSDTVTQGVRVKVQSFFLPTQSLPHKDQFMFAYQVTITNEGSSVVMLKSRHWVIMDQTGHKEEVRGPGVIGQQPVLLPGRTFQYSSGCPLRCPTGCMEGTYTFAVLDESEGQFKEMLDVRIARFGLNAKGEAAL